VRPRGAPGWGEGVPGHLCASGFASLSWGSALLPPFAGAPPGHPVPGLPADSLALTTLASTFSAEISVSIWQSLPGSFPPTRIDGAGFTGTGPSQFDLVWQPDTNAWLPLFAEGRIDVLAPTPEPAPLALWGLTCIGVAWAARRRVRRP